MPTTSNDALLAAGSAAAISAGNAFATSNLNKRNRKFSEEMYERQKADNIAFWNMQNAYNSPSSQMARFKEAGLNPNLIYGQQNTAGSITSADFKQPQQHPVQIDSNPALTAIDLMYNLEMKQAQTDNLKAQNAVILQEAVLKAAQVENTKAGTSRRLFDLDFESELRQTSVDARKEALRQLKVNTDLNIRRDIRDALMNSSNLKEAQERIKTMITQRAYTRAQTANTIEDRKRIINETARIAKSIDLMFQEGAIKDLDVKLAQSNVRPGDPIWYRSLGVIISSLFDQFTK